MKPGDPNNKDADHERRIMLDGAGNFRDIGGYPAHRHKRVKWRKIFRSGHLALLTKNDLQVLDKLGIQTICDFRSAEEIARQPNRLPENTSSQYLHLPIVNKTIEPTEAVTRVMKGDTSWFTKDFMVNAYIEKIDAFPDTWHRFFKCLTRQSSRPLMFHCTAGKDRTGVCAALILLTLGVSEKWVIHDHALSNIYNAEQLRDIDKNLRKVSVDPEKLKDYLTAPKTAMVATIEHLTKTYGSARDYLIQKAKVKAAWIENFAEDMLE